MGAVRQLGMWFRCSRGSKLIRGRTRSTQAPERRECRRNPGSHNPSLGPHRAAMHSELRCEHCGTEAAGAGCSHSVHFLIREVCSRSFLWIRRCADQWVAGLPGEVGIVVDALIPRGNQPLNPLPPVPATLHCAHQCCEISHIVFGETAWVRPLCSGKLKIRRPDARVLSAQTWNGQRRKR